jgi:aminoglycoside phosphotransferase (APT) family kinase protein
MHAVRSSLGAPTLASRKKPQPVPSMRSRLDANWSRLAGWRLRARNALRAHMDAMPDEQIAALETATETLGSLVRVLQRAAGT